MPSRIESESLYGQLTDLAATFPDFVREGVTGQLSAEALLWLGRCYALFNAVGLMNDAMYVANSTEHLGRPDGRRARVPTIRGALYRALASAELKAPVTSRGAFVAVGAQFDVFSSMSKILGEARADILLVDPYMDETTVIKFAPLASETAVVRLLADSATVKPGLQPAVVAWKAQYTASRQLDLKLSAPKLLHDRLILVDKSDVWSLSQSLKDFAKRSPGSFQKFDRETAALKIAAYEGVWATS